MADHTPSPFNVGEVLQHPMLGQGTVTRVTVNPRSCDKIEVLTLRGIDVFLAGSVACREWTLAASTHDDKAADFAPDWNRDGYHCEECATHAGYGIFHYDTLDEQRRKHQEKHGWGKRDG